MSDVSAFVLDLCLGKQRLMTRLVHNGEKDEKDETNIRYTLASGIRVR